MPVCFTPANNVTSILLIGTAFKHVCFKPELLIVVNCCRAQLNIFGFDVSLYLSLGMKRKTQDQQKKKEKAHRAHYGTFKLVGFIFSQVKCKSAFQFEHLAHSTLGHSEEG